MYSQLEQDLEKVGTEQAMMEKESRIAMAKEDEKEIYSAVRRKQEALEASTQDNFSLLNLILTTHNLTHCKTLMDAIREIHKFDLVFIRRITKELLFFRKICDSSNVYESLDEGDKAFYNEYMKNNPDPVDMAQKELEKVNALARSRSRANKYGIVTGRKAEKEFAERTNMV